MRHGMPRRQASTRSGWATPCSRARAANRSRCWRAWPELEPRPFRSDGPPIWLGGGGPRMLHLAGTTFDGWLPLSPTTDDFASGLRSVREAAEKAGRDPDSVAIGAYLTIAVADDRGEAAKLMDAYIRAYYGVPAEVMARTMAVHAGTLESAAEWIDAYAGAGARHIVVRLGHPTLSDYDETV